jgi:arginine-tRNA-protein transferase
MSDSANINAMIPLVSFLTPPSQCGYLPDRTWQLHYEVVMSASVSDYERRLLTGWRRFGKSFFRPKCPGCQACQSLRVDVAQFRPDRSQRRNEKANAGKLRLEIGEPSVSREKLDLYDRFHAYQVENIGWTSHEPKNEEAYIDSFVDNPFPAEEWRYFLQNKLVGVGYVDVMSSGLSAIYFYHDPNLRHWGLGTWNVLSVLSEALQRRLPHVYLGYYIAGCRSSEYKGRFRRAEVYDFPTATWVPFDGE